MTQRLLQTGLSLSIRGDETLAARFFAQVPDELADRNRLMEFRLYPLLPSAWSLIEENRRLERLAAARAWAELAEALGRQLEKEIEARHFCSLSPLWLTAI